MKRQWFGRRGAVVTLSGAASGPVRWTQLGGPAVTLSSTTSLTPSFTYPKMARPVGPAGNGNSGYVVHNEPGSGWRVTGTTGSMAIS